MKKVFLLMAVLFATAINSYAQELKIVDGFYKSGFYLQSNGLTIDEIVAAIEMDEMGAGTLDLVYKNEKANVFVVELSFNYMKDTIGRWISLVVPCKCFLRGESVKVVVSKAAMLVVLWTLGYWLSFGVTYAGTACFWDNSIAQNLLFSGVCWWVFGLLVTALTVLFSVLGSSFVLVLLGTGGVAFGAYTLSIIPKIDQFLPTYLTNGTALIYGAAQPKDFIPALIITGSAAAVCFAASISIFNKKRL